MSITSLGDLATLRLLNRHSTNAKAQGQLLAEELTTGVAKDRGRHLGGDLSTLASIETSLIRLGGYHDAALALSMTAGATQIAYQAVGTAGLQASGQFLSVSSLTTEGQIGTIAIAAVDHLGTVVSTLNTRFADRSLFSGQATNQAAIVPLDELLDLAEGVIAGASSLTDAETLLADWFADPAGFEAQAYLGAAPLGPLSIAPGETASLGLTVMDPTIVETLKALLLPALVDRGFLDGQLAAQTNLMRAAGVRLQELQSSWADTASRLGTTEAQLDAALSRNSAESSALELARLELIGLDGYETASRLEAVQTQLETIYTLTARIERLNLADFL